MSYYYCLFDEEYMGYYDVHSTSTLKSACAKVRKLLQDHRGADVGCVLTSDPSKLSGDSIPSSLVGFAREAINPKKRVRLTGINDDLLVPGNVYIFHKRKPHTAMKYWPEYIIKYDGTLVPRK